MSTTEPQGMLSRGLAILVALGRHPDGATATDVARDVGLAISTTHRLLATEVAEGFVHLDPATKRYRIGARVFELAHKATAVTSVAASARPTMRELSRATGETVQLAVLSHGRALFIEKVGTEQAVGIRGSVGDSEPLHLTSTGKVLLSQLDEQERTDLLRSEPLESTTQNSITDPEALEDHLRTVREQDFAIADEEFDAGVRALAVPVRDGRSRTRAALCLTVPAFRMSREQLMAWLPEVRGAGEEIGQRLPLEL